MCRFGPCFYCWVAVSRGGCIARVINIYVYILFQIDLAGGMADKSGLFRGISPENKLYMTQGLWADLVPRDADNGGEAGLAGLSGLYVSGGEASKRRVIVDKDSERIKFGLRESNEVLRTRIKRPKKEFLKIDDFFDVLRDRRDLTDEGFLRRRGKSKSKCSRNLTVGGFMMRRGRSESEREGVEGGEDGRGCREGGMGGGGSG